MATTRNVRVKICCILSAAEAQMAVSAGADALGFVSTMPSGPGIIQEAEIRAIAPSVPPTVSRFLLTSARSVAEVVRQQKFCRCEVIQLCQTLTDGTMDDLADALPGIRLIPVIHVTDETVIDQALQLAETADGLLLDTGNPKAAKPILGGTGQTHDWSISAKICRQTTKPVFLAGGLNVNNVAQAIEQVQPFGLDLCSGVRTNEQLDAQKLAAFMAAVRSVSR